MSLTQLIRETEVSRRIMSLINVPPAVLWTLKVPKLTNDPGRMGTAVDYGIRFWLQKKYGARHPNKLIAELAPQSSAIMNTYQGNLVRKITTEAMEFVRSANSFNRDFAYHCWQLAAVDGIWRHGGYPKNMPAIISTEDIVEFLGLMKLAVESWPTPERYCVLNPTFGWGSNLTNGADADMVQDGAIVDVKTVMKPDMPRVMKQLVGYAALAKLDGVDGAPIGEKVTHLGVYFSRHGSYQVWPIEQVISEEGLDELGEYFREYMQKQIA